MTEVDGVDDLDEDADWRDEDEPVREWVAPPQRDEDELAAIRTLRLVVVAVVLAAIGFVAIALARATEDDDGGERADVPTLGAAETVSVGPDPGDAVVDYVAGQRATLDAASGRRVAVVSLAAYRAAADVDALAASVPDIDVLARLIALPGGSPVVVDEPLENWLAGQRAPLQAERDEIAGLLPTIEDPDDPFIPGYEEDLSRLDAQLAALDPAAALVFGIVVRADADALRALAALADVRLVAPAADDDVAALATYRGLRPEEVDTAGTPDVRPTA
jgi:hypothetical protein